MKNVETGMNWQFMKIYWYVIYTNDVPKLYETEMYEINKLFTVYNTYARRVNWSSKS